MIVREIAFSSYYLFPLITNHAEAIWKMSATVYYVLTQHRVIIMIHDTILKQLARVRTFTAINEMELNILVKSRTKNNQV